MNNMINKESLYIQINKAIRQLIIKEKYSVGDKFLTERVICEQFEVSRSTANKSLSSLVSENILEFKKGVGTFIKSIPDRHNSFSLFRDPIEILQSQNKVVTVDILDKKSSLYAKFSHSEKTTIAIRKIIISETISAVELIHIEENYSFLFTDKNLSDSLISIVNHNKQINITETKDRLKSRISSKFEIELFESLNKFPILEITSEMNIDKSTRALCVKTLYNGDLISVDSDSQGLKIKFISI